MPVFVFSSKGVHAIGMSARHVGLVIMVLIGLVFPLAIGRIILYNIICYRLLFCRIPEEENLSAS